MKSDFEKTWEYVEKLERENEELKARLRKAQEYVIALSKLIDVDKDLKEKN